MGHGTARTARDTLITGMGFCLPGPGGMCADRGQFWDVISTGRSFVEQDGVFFGRVRVAPADVTRRIPELPAKMLRHYAPWHLYGLISLAEACADAGIDRRSGALADAAVIVARNGGDCWATPYLDILTADTDRLSVEEINELGVRMALWGIPMDVASVQAGLIGGTGPAFTVSCGCVSSSVAIGRAHRMIAQGDVDVAVVTGVDHYSLDWLLKYIRLNAAAGYTMDAMRDAYTGTTALMRPYDRRTPGSNMGNGAVTLVLESRERAEARGAGGYARVLDERTRRSPLHSAFRVDRSGAGAVHAARACLDAHGLDPAEIDYVNGGAEGDPVFHEVESNVYTELFGPERARTLPVSVQEACFGHSGGPLGALGAAATSLMIARDEACPTAACEEPAEACVFDPLPGGAPRPLEITHALSLNYTIGMISTAILLTKV